jgi:branched-subunit amino acid ABC-type transport system permease component
VDARWKTFVGFVILIIALVIRPQGIFGKARSI